MSRGGRVLTPATGASAAIAQDLQYRRRVTVFTVHAGS